jgi:HK97 family phage portal protein
MSTKQRGLLPAVKGIFFSIRDALAYRHAVHDPYKNITTSHTRNEPRFGPGTPHIDYALSLSTVWSCIRLIAETIATLPLITYEEKLVNGRIVRVPAKDFALYGLLHDSPNSEMTAVDFWTAVMFGLLGWGNAYVLKSYGSLGRLVALDPLNPALMTVRRLRDGSVQYLYADPTGPKEYTSKEVWHIKAFGSDGLMGISPIGMGWRSVSGATAAENASADMFTNDMRVSAVLTHKDFLKPEQREQLKTKWIGDVFGDSRTGQMMLIEGATEFKQLSINPVDAQMLETRSYSVEDLCRWFGVPPSMVGHGTAVSNWGTGREQQNLGFLQYVLRAYMVRIEQGIKKSLMTPAERLRYLSEFSVEGLLRADSATRYATYATQVQNGLKTRNECRALENDPPMDGGDELTVQVNLTPLKLLGKITNSAQSAKAALLAWLAPEKENDEA